MLENFSSRDIFQFIACAGDSKGTDNSDKNDEADSSVAESEENRWLFGILETEEEMVRIIGAVRAKLFAVLE